MREERGLDGLTMVIGMGDYLEIWNAEAWQSEQRQIDEVYAELLEGLAKTQGPAAQPEESS